MGTFLLIALVAVVFFVLGAAVFKHREALKHLAIIQKLEAAKDKGLFVNLTVAEAAIVNRAKALGRKF